MTSKDTFFDALREVSKTARRIDRREDDVLQAFRRVSETFSFTEDAVEIEQRATSSQNYLCVYPNRVSNGDFESDLTGWTEAITATGTTSQVSNESSKTLFGSQGSLKIDVTASSGAGQYVRRTQDIAGVSPGEVWSSEFWTYISALSDCYADVTMDFQDSGNSSLLLAVSSILVVESSWTQHLLEGYTAPASTDHIRIGLRMYSSSGASASGTGYFDLVRVEKASAISDRARRIIAGEFVCRT